MNKKIFRVRDDPMRVRDSDFNMKDGEQSDEDGQGHLTSMNEIVVRN